MRSIQWENSTSKLHYIKPHIEEWACAPCWKHYTYRHLMLRNDQQSIHKNVTCGNQILTSKHCSCPPNGMTANKL